MMTATRGKPEFRAPMKRDRETRAAYAERVEWLRKLHGALAPGDTVTTVLRHNSRSGMYRAIDLFLLRDGGERDWLSYWAAHAGIGDRWDDRHEAVGVSGTGMDMGFSLVYDLASYLYPDGFGCIGEGCPSNDHSNGDRDYTLGHRHESGGYALRHRWL